MFYRFRSRIVLSTVAAAIVSLLPVELPVLAADSNSDSGSLNEAGSAPKCNSRVLEPEERKKVVKRYSIERYLAIAKDPTQITRNPNLGHEMKLESLQAIRRAVSKSALESVRQNHPSNKYALAIAIARECSWCLKEANFVEGERLIDELFETMGGEFEFSLANSDSYDSSLSHEVSSLIPIMVNTKRSELRRKALKLIELNDAKTIVGTYLFADPIHPYGALSRDQAFCRDFYRVKKRRFERGGGRDRCSLYYMVEMAEYSGRYKDALAFEEALLNRVVSGEDSYPMVGAYLDLIRLKILAGKREEAREDFRNRIYEDDIVRRIQRSYDSRSHCNSFERFPSATLAELSMDFLYVDEVQAADEVFRESMGSPRGILYELYETMPLEKIVMKYSRFPRIADDMQSAAFEHLLSYYDRMHSKDKAISLIAYVIDTLSTNNDCREIGLYKLSDLQLLMGKYEPDKADEWRAKSDVTFSEYKITCVRDPLVPIREVRRKARLKELGYSI